MPLNNDDRQFYMARDNSYDIVNGGIVGVVLLRITHRQATASLPLHACVTIRSPLHLRSSTGYGIITASRLLLQRRFCAIIEGHSVLCAIKRQVKIQQKHFNENMFVTSNITFP